MPGLDIVTFGCRLNAHESQVMVQQAEAAGLRDAVIVNTCAVTAEAERQARQAIRRARRERPSARIIVAGCAAQIAPERFASMPEVDRILGNEEKLRLDSYGDAAARITVGDIMTVRETAGHLLDGFDGRARASLQVQQGCDHRCTFCVIPYGRGNSRSVPIGEIVRQARALVASGYREIVLTGVDITAFGGDLPGKPTLGAMVRRLLALVPDLPRLRLSSLDPVEIDDALWRLIAEEPRLMPHLHLSLQAGDDLVLKRMKRRHSRADAVAACRRARDLRPGVALGADLIAGFPTESEAMFENSLALVEECELVHLHVFPYSRRPGTPAAQMPQVRGPVIQARAARLREAGAKLRQRWLTRHVGRNASVVVERKGASHAEDYAPVRLSGGHPVGSILATRISGLDGDALIGEALVDEPQLGEKGPS
ncbi:MAG: tRNA (N(6)-L-threonylcarbamoyladenosine(37)-C(2))-methylthiotransferase MtaB [Alphaproteobacteria bacterium]|nr:tRNA (N(6)-L-threonylcarbamoyladenosine(37)-C(2))-methylthiotransferase MtaB [Alphaproteobacteria bacterium]